MGQRKPQCAVGGNVDSLWRTVWRRPLIFFLINNKTIIWSRSFTSGYLSEENKNTDLKRLLYPHIHCSIIYNSQDTESLIPMDGWRMDEWMKWCVCIHILFSHKKEWNLAICDNMDESWGHYAKWVKTDKDKYYMMSPIEFQNKDIKNRLVVVSGMGWRWAKW